jgi:GT2 family glycosyltransferase
VAEATVVALLLNWRRSDLTLRCLADLAAVREVALRIVVIDNGSGPEVVAALRQGIADLPANAPPIELSELPDNRGFTGGMNAGLARVGQAPFVLVLNNDLRLPNDFLAPLCAVLQNDPQVAAVTPTVLHPDGSVWAEGGERGFLPNGLRLRGHGKAPRPRTHGPEAVGFVPCACVLFRASAIAAAGRFDDAYFMYWEDVALSERLAEAGGKLVWLPWVRVEHAAGQSSGGGRSPLRKFLMANNHVRFLKAHGRARDWIGWLCCDVLPWPLTLSAGPRAAFAKLRGMLAGLRGHRAGAADVERYLPR